MDYNRQIEEIVNYIKGGEKERKDYKIGMEFEHFVIDKNTLKTISYYGKDGVGETLKDLERLGWKGVYEGEYILGLNKDDKTITLEPGSQLELSVDAKENIEDMERGYLEFLKDIIPILHGKNQELIATSYHPETKIDEITLLPKGRYDLMFNYFKDKGKHAHNMMKGTAALQISIDYESEEDYRKKFKVANAISPILYGIFDGGYYFEGEKWGRYNLRTFIWNNCDDDRCGIVENALNDNFGYEEYAKYALERPPIFTIRDNKTIATGNKLIKDILDPENYKKDELEHLLTMFFPDVRTKRYIEIRMMDSVPYPLNFSAAALLKGIFYNEKNLNMVYDYIKDLNIYDINRYKENIIDNGLRGVYKDKTIVELGKWLVGLAKEGLGDQERRYIKALEEMLLENKNPYEIIKENVNKREALDWCILKI